uniref:Parathyroid hormone-like hormone b n=1 Tax=Oryzias sinensis TaxID=183150 RepID=A0A8C7YU74_9TELE
MDQTTFSRIALSFCNHFFINRRLLIWKFCGLSSKGKIKKSILRRSVSHVQLMHDKSRSMQEFRRSMWLHELVGEVNTADRHAPPVQSRTPTQTFSGNFPHQKSPGATKNLPEKFKEDREGPNLPQETNKAMAYKEDPLKVATKRKKKARLGRRRESEKKRRRA